MKLVYTSLYDVCTYGSTRHKVMVYSPCFVAPPAEGGERDCRDREQMYLTNDMFLLTLKFAYWVCYI